jgi:hypothetical protein
MPSVGVSWSGSCPPTLQEELVRLLARLADVNDELLRASPPPPNEFKTSFSEGFMTPEREASLRSRPNVDRIERTIAVPIEIDSGIFADYRQFHDGAEQYGIPVVAAGAPVAEEGLFTLNLNAPRTRRSICLKGASIYGINFKVFGVGYPWYPGEDRISFVFLRCPRAPFLDGRVVDVFHRTEMPGLIRFETIRLADWYVEAPGVHLRYYLEDWINYFLAWVKFFFMPDLHWWAYENLPGYDRMRPEFEALQAKVGAELARSAAFEDVLAAFMREAGYRTGGPRQKESPDSEGVSGRVLRTLRQSGEADAD